MKTDYVMSIKNKGHVDKDVIMLQKCSQELASGDYFQLKNVITINGYAFKNVISAAKEIEVDISYLFENYEVLRYSKEHSDWVLKERKRKNK